MQFITTLEDARATVEASDGPLAGKERILIRLRDPRFDSVAVMVSRECAKELRDQLDAVLFEEELVEEETKVIHLSKEAT